MQFDLFNRKTKTECPILILLNLKCHNEKRKVFLLIQAQSTQNKSMRNFQT